MGTVDHHHRILSDLTEAAMCDNHGFSVAHDRIRSPGRVGTVDYNHIPPEAAVFDKHGLPGSHDRVRSLGRVETIITT